MMATADSEQPEKDRQDRTETPTTMLPRGGVSKWVVNWLHAAGDITPLRRLAHWREAARHRAWDRAHGVETAAYVSVEALRLMGLKTEHSESYIPCKPFDMKWKLRKLNIDYPRTIFVDLGAGKGRVILMALGLPFKRVIGVELSPELARIARENVHLFRGRVQCTDVEIVCQDAAEYVPPDDPLVVFLFNPFDDVILHSVANHLMSSWRANSRRIVVYYSWAVHANVWEAAGFHAVARHGRTVVLESPAG